MKKTIIFFSVFILIASLAFAGGDKEEKQSERIVTVTSEASKINNEWFVKMNEAFTAETGIKVVVQPTPGDDEDNKVKVNIDLMAGSDIDVVPSLGRNDFSDRADAGFFMAFDEIAKDYDIDLSLWGSNLEVSADGHVYGLPVKQELYCVFYNKDLFDKAGIAYPEGAWTWDEFEETTLKLSSLGDDIYGAYMPGKNPHVILRAKQEGIEMYKEDGTCNFDDPAFKEAIEWYKGLEDNGSLMSFKALSEDNANWNYYAINGDKLGMFVQGNFFTRLLNNSNDYPRDWKYGVAQLPTGGADSNNNFVSMEFTSVNKNAAHREEAITYSLWLAKNQYKYENQLPALSKLTEEEKAAAFSTIANASNGQVTVDDLYNAWINTGFGAVDSDIIGETSAVYTRAINDEVQAYLLGMQDLDTAIKNVCDTVNEAIRNM